MRIGYARVSTIEQNLDLQEDALKAAGCEKVYTDKTGGTRAERPGLERTLADLRPGDKLVVWKPSGPWPSSSGTSSASGPSPAWPPPGPAGGWAAGPATLTTRRSGTP